MAPMPLVKNGIEQAIVIQLSAPSVVQDVVPEAELLARVVRKDQEAFGLFYDRFGPVLFSLCLRILRDRRDAEDVLQEVFIQVWRDAARFDESRASIRAWLFTIARSRALDRYRSRKVTTDRIVETDTLEENAAVAGAEADGLKRRDILQQMAKLSEPERNVLNLAYYEGLTQEEIAARLEVPLGTIKSRARAGLSKLRAFLTPVGAHV